jgi:hypothetical protein
MVLGWETEGKEENVKAVVESESKKTALLI